MPKRWAQSPHRFTLHDQTTIGYAIGPDQIIKPLHGLRGIAALTVVVGHFIAGGTPALGVVLFFVLSGFLIGKLYLDRPFTSAAVWHYAVARFARVYPLFAVVIIGTVLLNTVTNANVFGLAVDEIWAHLALAGDARTVWTISTEFQFYLLFILIWALRSRLPSALNAILPLLLLALAVAYWIGTDATRIGIFGYFHVFLLGVLTAVLIARADETWQTLAAVALPVFACAYLMAFAVIPSFYTPRWVYLDMISVGICAALLASTLLGGNCLGNRLLSRPVFIWLGEISFGVYLLHRHAQWFVDALLDQAPIWASLPLKIVLTLILAQLANWLIERPCRRWIRQGGDRAAERMSGFMKA